MNIGFIGQRFGGTAPEDAYPLLVEFFSKCIQRQSSVAHWFVATGVGTDLAFIEAVVEAGHPVTLLEPFEEHTTLWPSYWRSRYRRLSASLDRETSAQGYFPGAFDRRNATLLRKVGSGGELWVFWDGQTDFGVSRVLGLAAEPGSPEVIRNLALGWRQ